MGDGILRVQFPFDNFRESASGRGSLQKLKLP